MNIDWGFTLAVVVVGLVVVFAVLLILVLLCTLMGMIFKIIDKNKIARLESAKIAETLKPAPVAVVATPAPAPIVEEGITDDVVAAISAAIACIMGDDNHFVVKSVKRTRGSRPAWNLAGISENTRPY